MIGLKKQFVFLFSALCWALPGFCDEEEFIDERIRFLEKKQGYGFSKGRDQGLLEADLIYWKADVDGVGYATKSLVEQANGSSGNVDTHIRVQTPQFSYDPGFRLGLGFQAPFDLYDVFVVWTRFSTLGKDKAEGTLVFPDPVSGNTVIVDQIGLIKDLASVPNEASAKCGIKNNVLDVQLARGIAMSRSFFLRPYFGVRGVWSAIDWRIRVGRQLIALEPFNQDSTQLKVKNDFQAVGGLVGLEMDWSAPLGFGVTIRGAGALVWGRSEEMTRQKYLVLPSESSTVLSQDFKADNAFYCVKGILELFAGAFWETNFSKSDKKDVPIFPKKLKQYTTLRVFAGFEFQQWPYIGQKTNTQINRQRDRFTLGFQGFTGGLKLVF